MSVRVVDLFRLFLAPGVNHCGGGFGPNSSFAYTLGNDVGAMDADHDILAALDRWVEHGVAPSRLMSSVLGSSSLVRPCGPWSVVHASGPGRGQAATRRRKLL